MKLKPFLTIENQIALLESRGMIINDKIYAENILRNLNYYRISGYALTLKRNDKFNPGVNFTQMMEIYNFDKDLKYLLLSYLEDIEISLRTHIAYTLGKIGPNSYLDTDNFISEAHHKEFKKELQSALKDSRSEAFIKHHNTKYNGQLPIWVVVETLSFGALSRLYSSLNKSLQKEICELYYHPKIRYTYIGNWLESLVVLRNLCAHHSRIFNRGLPNAFKFPDKDFTYLTKCNYENNQIGKKLFFAMIIINRISSLSVSEFESDLQNIQSKYPFVDISHYGFKNNWKTILDYLNSDYK